jgi:hypothetical protein
MSENLIKYFIHDMTTLGGAQIEARKLFMWIEDFHGIDQAKKIFRELGEPLSKSRINELKNWALLSRYDEMEKPNVAELARQIVEENASLSEERQLTPRYRPSLPTVDKHLRNLLRERQEGLEAETWQGPTSMRRLNREWDEWIEAEIHKSGSSET